MNRWKEVVTNTQGILKETINHLNPGISYNPLDKIKYVERNEMNLKTELMKGVELYLIVMTMNSRNLLKSELLLDKLLDGYKITHTKLQNKVQRS